MTSATESLKDLHQLHLHIEESQAELDRGPKQIKARGQIVLKKKAALDQYLEELKELKLYSDKKSLDLKTLEAKIEDLKSKLNIANSNREFDIIKGQISADTMAKSVLEDEILEILDRIDEESNKQKSFENDWEEAKAEEKRFTEQFALRSEELKKLLSELKQKLVDAEKMLPPEPLVLYRRLVAQKGAKAMAKLVGSACSNCYVSITAQQKILINTDSFQFCTSCGSLLYKGDPEEEK